MATAQELMTLPLDQAIEAYSPEFERALPDNIPLQRFKRVIQTALAVNSDLIRADRKTLLLACQRAAQDGLYPDGREAALVPYQGKVQYQPMVHGIRKRMMNSGWVRTAVAEVVYENDYFEREMGDNPSIVHRPPRLGEDRGEMIGAYAVITLKTGELVRDVMDRHEIERIRDMYSKASRDDAPWKRHPGEMWKKTVLKRCSKMVPFASDDERLVNILAREYDNDVIDGDYSHVPLPTEALPPRPSSEDVGPNGSKPPTRQRTRKAAASTTADSNAAEDADMAGRFPADQGEVVNGEDHGAASGEQEGRLPPDMEPDQTDETDIILPGDQPDTEAKAEAGDVDPDLIPFDGQSSQAWYREARAHVEGMIKQNVGAERFRHFAQVNKVALDTLKGPGPNAFRSLWAILDKALRYYDTRK